MAELTQTQIEAKISIIDANIETITTALAGGTTGAQFTKYKIGSKEVDGSQQLEGLLKSREMYQKLLDGFPSEKITNVDYDVQTDGDDCTELVGDE